MSIESAMHRVQLYGKRGERVIYFGDIAEVGDSIYKERGSYAYIVVKRDSSYAEYWACDSTRPIGGDIFGVKRWRNGDSVDLKAII